MRFFGIPPLRRVLGLLGLLFGVVGWVYSKTPYTWWLHPRVTDEIGLLQGDSRDRHEVMLQLLADESGVDLRYLLVSGTGAESIERFAVRRARELGIGRDSDRRGLLIVYDSTSRAMRIEVGPTLQGVLTDAFIGFVVREHASSFFRDADPELGLRLTVRILQWRIREAQLGEAYDPRLEQYVGDVRRLASGGGATATVSRPAGRRLVTARTPTAADSARFRPQPTVEEAYHAYQRWLALEDNVARVPLFTQQSQGYLAGLPLTRGYKAGWLAMEYGKAYAVDQRGDLAMLYYTGTPFASPHFFRRSTAGWQLDVLGELHNTLEAIGGWYSWILLESGDEYAREFADRWQPYDDGGFGEYFRVAGGDNRRLMTRTATAAASAGATVPVVNGVERLTVYQVAERIRAAGDRPSVVVLYSTEGLEWQRDLPGLAVLADSCRAHAAELLAFDVNPEQVDLPALFARWGIETPPRSVYRWKNGLMSSSLGPLGIRIGASWTTPLIAVRRGGRVVAQAQAVQDWDAVAGSIGPLLADDPAHPTVHGFPISTR